MATETTMIPYVEGSAPATPAAGRVVTYAKADGLMYSKDDAGVETLMSGGAGGGGGGTPTFIGAKAYSAATQSITGATVTAVTLGSEEFDTTAFHDNASNNTRMTIPSGKDGYYLVEGQTFVNSTTDWFGIRLNNTSYVRGSTQNLPSAGRWQISCIVNLVATDYIEMQANTSGAITFGFASTNPDAQTVLAISFLGA